MSNTENEIGNICKDQENGNFTQNYNTLGRFKVETTADIRRSEMSNAESENDNIHKEHTKPYKTLGRFQIETTAGISNQEMSKTESEIENIHRDYEQKNMNNLTQNCITLGRFQVETAANIDCSVISNAESETDNIPRENHHKNRKNINPLGQFRVENAAGCSYSKSPNAEQIGNIHRKYSQIKEFQSERYLRAIPSRDRSRRATWNRNANSRHYPCLTNIICFWRRSRTNSYELEEIKKSDIFPETDENGNRNRGHQYTALGNGPAACEDVGEYLEMEKRTRDRALSICQTYIQQTARYSLIKQLNNVGSRVDKYWFAVRDTMLKTDRLLTLVPLNRNCSLSICPSTKDILNNLFLALQHPYICPVLDLEFVEYEGQNYVILVQPINQGSLKDLIYGIERNCWNEDWGQKYAARGKGLPLPQIQQMGRQILEALVFLKERGFPTVTHLHSGNVVVQNGVARLAGLENSLLGFTSRIHPVVTSRSPNGSSIDSICFGHMLFEMCAGYELCSFKPSSMHLSDLKMYPQVANLMTVIFSKTNGRYPSVEELLVHDLFRNIDLREMRSAPVTIFRPTLTPSILNLLDGIKRHNSGKRMSSTDTEDMISLKSPEVETAEEDSLLTQIYNELSNTTV